MSTEAMMQFLDRCDEDSRFRFRVVSHCAPVLKGIKISNIISIECGSFKKLCAALKGSRIICISLFSDKKREVLLLFRYRDMENYLRKKDIREFLRRYGYTDFSLTRVIRRLRERYAAYADGQIGFPHELGVILGYPLSDVEGFIRNQGKGCLLEKYWKVYSEPQKAARLFARYDRAKETAMQEVVEGYLLSQVAVS